MSEGITNELMFEVLKKLQADMGEVRRDLRELKFRQTATEDHIRGIMSTLSIITEKLDHYGDRLERIENRLGLIDA